MRIQLALYAKLQAHYPGGGRQSRDIDVPASARVSDVIETLGLPDEPRVVFVNNKHADEDATLAEGDRLAIFPPVAGGSR